MFCTPNCSRMYLYRTVLLIFFYCTALYCLLNTSISLTPLVSIVNNLYLMSHTQYCTDCTILYSTLHFCWLCIHISLPSLSSLSFVCCQFYPHQDIKYKRLRGDHTGISYLLSSQHYSKYSRKRSSTGKYDNKEFVHLKKNISSELAITQLPPVRKNHFKT